MDSSKPNNYNGIDNETLVSFRSQGLFTDVRFLVNGIELEAHKIVLASRSDVFQAMFSSGMAESRNHVTVNIDDIDEDVFSTFLDYMYTLDESLVKSRLTDLLMCADKYNVDSLLSACDRAFASTISKDNIFDYLDISETFRRQRIKDSAVEFLRKNLIAVVHNHELWSRFHNRFDTLTHLIGSYSRFIDFKEYHLNPDLWTTRNAKDSFLLAGNLSVEVGARNCTFIVEVDYDARGECLLGLIHLDGDYLASIKVYVWLEIECDNQSLLRDKMLIRWSKLCSVDTSMDMECWKFVDGNPLPIMSTGPIIFTLPNASIFNQTITLKIALSSLRPQSILDSSTEFLTPSEMSLSELSNLFSSSNNVGFSNDFGLKSNFNFQWSGFRPALTVENAPSYLFKVAVTDAACQDENQTEKLKHLVLQFMKFHSAKVIKSNDWTILQSRPDLLRDILIVMAE